MCEKLDTESCFSPTIKSKRKPTYKAHQSIDYSCTHDDVHAVDFGENTAEEVRVGAQV